MDGAIGPVEPLHLTRTADHSNTADPLDLPVLLSAAEVEQVLQTSQLPVLRYLAARTDTRIQAAELTQETLVRAFCALETGARPRHPVPWILGIARHVLLESWRGERYRRQLEERLRLAMGPAWEGLPGTPAPPGMLSVTERESLEEGVHRRVVVADALTGLAAELRVPVLLHYFADLPVTAIASHLGITPSAVKMRLLRARLALRAPLQALHGPQALHPARGARVVEDTMEVKTRHTTSTSAIARQAHPPPTYDSLEVGFHVGGTRGATSPLSDRVFSAAGLTLPDLRFGLERLQAVIAAGERPLCGRLRLWPALDPFAHPEPATVWRLLREAEIGTADEQQADGSQLVPTDGWRIGTDPNWRRLLEDLQQAGLKHVWFTFLGLEDTHDTLCDRPGAFAAIVAAMERCAAAGLQTGANVVVSTRSTREVTEVTRLVRLLGGERYVPTYVEWWSPWVPAYETIRPEPPDLVGLPPLELDANWGYKDFWAAPAQWTEAALTKAALGGTPPEPTSGPSAGDDARSHSLIVDGNLDLLVGDWWAPPLQRVGNLREDSPEEIHRTLLALPPPIAPPPDTELAERYGDRTSRKLHTRADSLRRKWVHAWRAEHHRA